MTSCHVMPGLVPGIQGGECGRVWIAQGVQRTSAFVTLDCRHKAGNDGREVARGRKACNETEGCLRS